VDGRHVEFGFAANLAADKDDELRCVKSDGSDAI